MGLIRFFTAVSRLWIALWKAREPMKELGRAVDAETKRVEAMYGTQYAALHACLVGFLVSHDPVGWATCGRGHSRNAVQKSYRWPAVRILNVLAGSRSSTDVRHRLYWDARGWVDGLDWPTHLGTESDYAEIAERLWALMQQVEGGPARAGTPYAP